MDHAAKLAAAHEAFGPDKVAMLKTHLEAQIAVEFFTIPFYLTAVYSFTDDALKYSPDGSKYSPDGSTQPFFDLQQKALSVAVQEMYHFQEACNLANVFGVTPDLPAALKTVAAGADIAIPHLDPHGDPLVASLGNLPHAIQVMIEIETPDDNPTPPVPNATATYPSIGDLYHATLQLIAGYLDAFGDVPEGADPHFQPGHKQVAYKTFYSRYTYNKICNREGITHAAGAIVEQGEGPEAVPPSWPLAVDNHSPEVPKRYQSKGRFAQYDTVTHFARFEAIEEALKESMKGGPYPFEVFYEPADPYPPEATSKQEHVDTLWSYLIDTILTGFANGSLEGDQQGPSFTSVMTSFKYTLPALWKLGACPSFGYKDDVKVHDVDAALDAIDPLCLFHWDAATQEVREAGHFNACQGLNACKGQGWGGIASEPGDGACATADFHTCQGGNDCSNQGGCGFLSPTPPEETSDCTPPVDSGSNLLPAAQQWIPGENTGKLTGGCQTPIATGQKFNSATSKASDLPADWTQAEKDRIAGLRGTPVWDQARKLLGFTPTNPMPKSEEKGGVNYDGNARRAKVAATSTS